MNNTAPDTKQRLHDNINMRLEEIEQYIENKCEVIGTSIKQTSDGFTIAKTYALKKDYDKVFDKDGKEIHIGDIVKIPTTYYGIATGKVVSIDTLESLVDVNINNDVFYSAATKCKVVESSVESSAESSSGESSSGESSSAESAE